MAINRRGFVQAGAALVAWWSGVERVVAAAAADGQASSGQGQPFSFRTVVAEARKRAATAFVPPPAELPDGVAHLTYDQYRDIRFKPESAIWLHDDTRFRLDLFHLGFVYKEPVQIAIVDDGRAVDIPFSPDLFQYGKLVKPPDKIAGLGFSGFRARYPINSPDVFDEFIVFQGASYFRAVARNQLYGLSARGLAINTAEPQGEEFPVFRKYWIEKPAPDADTLVVHALLDSVSVTGAYRFQITPGAETVCEVKAMIFVRKDVKKIGIAPLTSMFLFDGINRKGFDDYRNAVHDSDGLQMLTGRGEWLWRPLANPKTLQISDFSDQTPRGFGLMQRARRYEDYEDPEAKYERRPSLWIEPIGDWGKGYVELVEIPTDREINDNIVAYWRPDGTVSAGKPLQLAYRMHWTDDIMPPQELLSVSASRAGLSFDQKRRMFVIDYRAGPDADPIATDGLDVNVTASVGKVQNIVIHHAQPDHVLRISFEVDLGGAELSELRMVLMRDGKPAGETWLFRWTAS